MNIEANDSVSFVGRVLAAVQPRQPADVLVGWGAYAPCATPPRARGVDGHIEVTCQRRKIHYHVELMQRPLHGVDVPRLLGLRQELGGERLLVLAEQVSQAQADRLIKAGVEFMDAAGNVYLRLPGLVWLTTGLRAKTMPRPPDRSRLFRTAGVKLLFLFLGDVCRVGLPPDRRYLNRPYRDMVAAAGIAFGSISVLMRELEANGYLMPRAEDDGEPAEPGAAVTRRDLDRTPELVDRWVRAYDDVLRPKLVLARYRAADPQWWRTAVLDSKAGLWGGEVAAARLTGLLKPEVVTIYRQAHLTPWLVQQRLVSDPAGPVEVLDAFWHDPGMQEGGCVLPLLTYADLLASDVERNIEIARGLYENRLRHLIEAG